MGSSVTDSAGAVDRCRCEVRGGRRGGGRNEEGGEVRYGRSVSCVNAGASVNSVVMWGNGVNRTSEAVAAGEVRVVSLRIVCGLLPPFRAGRGRGCDGGGGKICGGCAAGPAIEAVTDGPAAAAATVELIETAGTALAAGREVAAAIGSCRAASSVGAALA